MHRKNYIDCLKEFIDVIDWETDHLEGTMKIDAEIAKVTKDLLEKMHSQYNLSDTSNYDWDSASDYYGDHLSYMRLNSSLQEWLVTELDIA